MNLTLPLPLFPGAELPVRLLTTVDRFHEAADWLAGKAFAARSANKVELQRAHDRELRERFGLSSVVAVKAIPLRRLARLVEGDGDGRCDRNFHSEAGAGECRGPRPPLPPEDTTPLFD